MRALSVLAMALLIGVFSMRSPGAIASNPEEIVAPGSCTFTIKGTVNGTPVDVTVTVSEVSAFECTLMKAAAKKAADPPKK